MTKRKQETDFDELFQNKKFPIITEKKNKHSLDSDEDSEDEEKFNVFDEDIEGEENGESRIIEDIKITPFNMNEELEEGHFDKDGHYHFDKSKQIKDSWLDNIDWIKIKKLPADTNKTEETETEVKEFDPINVYSEIIKFMIPGESIRKSLQRIGGKNAKLSSVERQKRRKAGIIDESAAKVEKLTEFCNEVLMNTGNMLIYEETYEMITKKLNAKKLQSTNVPKTSADPLDMYSDDFDEKEKVKLETSTENETDSGSVLLWEFKWIEQDNEIYGPYRTEQMQQWVDEGYFQNGIFVRKVGSDDEKFYSSKRIDFELYL